MPPPATLPRSAFFWVTPTAVVALLGIVHLPTPFRGDQALYALAGGSILDGDVMYRDFGDIKHPGVHYYYALAQLLFRPLRIGVEAQVHLFELLVWLAFGLFLQCVLRSRLQRPLLAAAAPLATAGAYYSSVSAWHLTQIEALPGTLLCVSAWLAAGSPERHGPRARWWALAAGALAATAVVFHGHMWPVPVALLATATLASGTATLQERARHLGVALAGLVATLTALATVFVAAGAGRGLFEVYVSYPRSAAVEVPADLQGLARLRLPLEWYVRTFAPWLVLATACLFALPRLRREAFALAHLAWGLTALLVMALEARTSWPFHFLYFVVPVGVLAIFGVDAVAERLGSRLAPERRLTAVLALALPVLALAPAVVRTWSDHARAVARQVQSDGWSDFDAYRLERSERYRLARRASAPLRREDALPGPVFAFGNPLFFTLSGRRQALVRNGWGYEVALERHWQELPAELAARRPAYVYLDALHEPLVRERSPATFAHLDRHYVEERRDEHGVLLRRRAEPPTY